MANGRFPCVYISGPMRGMWNENRHLFEQAEKRLIELGCDTINPVTLADDYRRSDPAAGIRQFLATDLSELCLYADAVVVIGDRYNIQYSRGVNAELKTADRLGIPTFRYWAHLIDESSMSTNQLPDNGFFDIFDWRIGGSLNYMSFKEWLETQASPQ